MKLYRFRYSGYARKVQMLLGLLGRRHELIEVKYSDRTALAELTGGYIYVPVLVDDDGSVHVDSRQICEHLLTGDAAAKLTPAPLQGPIWAYADFCDGPLEDVLFRIASPDVRDAWSDPGERALYTLIKERKFGAGCVDAWAEARQELMSRAQRLLSPTLSTLSQTPFLFGTQPTLADVGLYGNLAMLHEASPALVPQLASALPPYMARLEAAQQL
jgi:glutathione S-transferase